MEPLRLLLFFSRVSRQGVEDRLDFHNELFRFSFFQCLILARLVELIILIPAANLDSDYSCHTCK